MRLIVLLMACIRRIRIRGLLVGLLGLLGRIVNSRFILGIRLLFFGLLYFILMVRLTRRLRLVYYSVLLRIRLRVGWVLMFGSRLLSRWWLLRLFNVLWRCLCRFGLLRFCIRMRLWFNRVRLVSWLMRRVFVLGLVVLRLLMSNRGLMVRVLRRRGLIVMILILIMVGLHWCVGIERIRLR